MSDILSGDIISEEHYVQGELWG